MTNRCTNIYKLARKSTLYSREDAAEFLHISDRSLAAYESGERIPPIDVVNRMTILYHRPDLAVDHVRIATEDMQATKDIFPNMQEVDLRGAGMEILWARGKVVDVRFEQELIDILRDGIISDDEEERYEALCDDLRVFVSRALTVIFARRNGNGKREGTVSG